MPDLGDIFVTIGLDASGLKQQLDQAVSDVKSAAGGMASAFSDVTDSVGKAGQQVVDTFNQAADAGKNFQKALQDSLQSLGTDLRTVGTDLTAAVTVPLTAMAAAAVAASLDITAAMNTLRQTTEGLGPELDSLKQSFNDVFATVPAKAADVAAALAMINDRMHITGDEATTVATQFLNLARVTGEQVVPLVTAASQAFNAWGISADDLAGKLDFVRNVANDTGIKVGSLLTNLKTFAPALQELGYSFDQATGLIAKFDQEGVNVSKALGGLRLALNNLSKAGLEDPIAGLQIIIQMIKDAGSAGEANQIGLKAFGRGAQDLVLAIRQGKLDIDDFVKSMENSRDTINKAAADTVTLAQQFTLFKNQVEQALAPIGDALGNIAIQIMQAAGPIVEWIGNVAKAFASLPEPAQVAIVVIAGLAAAIGPALLALGLFMQGLSALLPIIGTVTVALGLGTGMTGVLMTLVGAVTLVAGAFAGWELGTWLQQNIPLVQKLGDTFGDLLVKIPGVQSVMDRLNGTTTDAANAQKQLQLQVDGLAAKLKAQGVTIDKTGLSLEQYSQKLVQAAADMGKAGDSVKTNTDKAGQSVDEMTRLIGIMVSGAQKASAALETVVPPDISDKIAIMAATLSQLTAAYSAQASAIAGATIAKQHYNELDQQIIAYTTGLTDQLNYEASAWMTLKNAVENVDSQFNATALVLDTSTQSFKQFNSEIFSMIDQMPGGLATIRAQVDATSKSFSDLGISFHTSVQTQIADYNNLMSQGLLTAKQALTAEKAILMQEIQDQKDAGDAISQAYLDRLHEVQKALKAFGDDALWKDIDNEVNKLSNDFSEGFATALVSGKDFVNQMSLAFQKLGTDFVKFVIQELLKTSGILDAMKKQLEGIMTDIFGSRSGSGGAASPSSALSLGTKVGNAQGVTNASQPGQVVGYDEMGNPQVMDQSTGGAAGGAADTGGGGLLGDISGMVSMVTGIISAISGIISNFQLAHMNTNIARIEESTRRLDIFTEQMFPIFVQAYQAIRDGALQAGDKVTNAVEKLTDAIKQTLGGDQQEGVLGALKQVAASLLDLIASFHSSAGNPVGGGPTDVSAMLDTDLRNIDASISQSSIDIVAAIKDGVQSLNQSLAAMGSGIAFGGALTAVAAAGGGSSGGGMSIGNLNINDPNVLRIGQQLIAAMQARGLKSY